MHLNNKKKNTEKQNLNKNRKYIQKFIQNINEDTTIILHRNNTILLDLRTYVRTYTHTPWMNVLWLFYQHRIRAKSIEIKNFNWNKIKLLN